jgi:outer membrane protein OmpA-like peptidoglycan-associated protein
MLNRMNNSMINLFGKSICTALAVILVGCAAPASKSGNGAEDANSDSARRNAVVVTQTAEGALITTDERILFDVGSAVIKPEGEVFLQRVAKIANEKTKAQISIKGHTDNAGTPVANLALSERRAQATRASLIKAGVDAKRIIAKGYGLTMPIASNTTPEGRQANRRSEIVAVGESVENIGGTSLGDKLQEGFANFLKDPMGTLKNVFGG